MYARSSILVLLFVISFPSTAAAEWILSPYVGARFAASSGFGVLGQEGTEQTKFTFGSSFGILTSGAFGVEADVAFVPGFFTGGGLTSTITDSRVTTIMGNVIVAMPLAMTQYGLRPYFTSGAGLLRARGTGTGINRFARIAADMFAMNVGGGAIGPISPRTSLRVDLRYFRNVSGDAEALPEAAPGDLKLSFWRATVGLTYRF